MAWAHTGCEEIFSPDDSGPAVEPWEPRRVVEMTDHRVRYAVHHENDGPAARRQELVASRAARAMRDGDRYMDGSPRDGLPRIPRAPQIYAAMSRGRQASAEAEAGS